MKSTVVLKSKALRRPACRHRRADSDSQDQQTRIG
jgi:hypothetical protein